MKQIEGIAGGATYSGTYNKHTGLLYIGGNVGIFAYDVASDEIAWRASKADGLMDNELWWNDALKSSSEGTSNMGHQKV